MISLQEPPTLSPDDLRRIEEDTHIEFVDGQILEKPMSMRSAKVASTIIFLLEKSARETGEVNIFTEVLGYKCYPEDPNKFRRPDVSVVRTERLAGIDPDEGFLRFPADLVVEVLSPNDLAYQVARKVDEYLEHGFRLIWVVNPDRRVVQVHRADGSSPLLREKDVITGETVLPGFSCEVGEFFA